MPLRSLPGADEEEGIGTSYGFCLNKPWRRRRASGVSLREGLAGLHVLLSYQLQSCPEHILHLLCQTSLAGTPPCSF